MQEEDDEDLFSMEAAGCHRSVAQVARDSLDSGLMILFNYIKDLAAVSVDPKDEKDPLKAFYFDFLSVFESTLLPVYATGHVQVNSIKHFKIVNLDCAFLKLNE